MRLLTTCVVTESHELIRTLYLCSTREAAIICADSMSSSLMVDAQLGMHESYACSSAMRKAAVSTRTVPPSTGQLCQPFPMAVEFRKKSGVGIVIGGLQGRMGARVTRCRNVEHEVLFQMEAKRMPAPCGCKGLAVIGSQKSGHSSRRMARLTPCGVKQRTVCCWGQRPLERFTSWREMKSSRGWLSSVAMAASRRRRC